MGEEQIAPLRRGCEVGTELCDARDLILEFVESRMEFIAPNVCRTELSKLITNLYLNHTSHKFDQFFKNQNKIYFESPIVDWLVQV